MWDTDRAENRAQNAARVCRYYSPRLVFVPEEVQGGILFMRITLCPHFRSLIRYKDDGKPLDTHDQMPDELRQQIYKEERQSEGHKQTKNLGLVWNAADTDYKYLTKS
jgi:hypothetical protein